MELNDGESFWVVVGERSGQAFGQVGLSCPGWPVEHDLALVLQEVSDPFEVSASHEQFSCRSVEGIEVTRQLDGTSVEC
ncbi:MAG: hypothetical protein ACR2LA_10940, partial [Acidimicrobiales bacterium]